MNYPKPKVILIDLENDCNEKLNKAGYNVSTGSFGKAYKVTKIDKYDFIYADYELPNLREQEIVVIDLQQNQLLDEIPKHKVTRDSDIDVKIRLLNGFVDPRPLTMLLHKQDFGVIWSNGGIFIVFAEPFLKQEIYSAEKNSWKEWQLKSELEINIWSFLPFFEKEMIIINDSSGDELFNAEKPNHWTPILTKYLKNAHYAATIHKSFRFNGELLPILFNKYKEPIGCILATNTNSFMVILPHLRNKGELLVELFSSLLPEIKPELFPFNEGNKWINRSEYEFNEVKIIKSEIEKIVDEKEKQIFLLNQKIESIKEKHSFLFKILTETGEGLVEAIEAVLSLLDFKSVKNIDKEIESKSKGLPKQEDLQILDSEQSLLVEIKGIIGLPREEDTFQIVKYITRRMKEWGKTTVRGLVIVNHQKNIPALDREFNPFTEQQINDAKHNDFGLITTWTLFLLIKGMFKHNWDKEIIRRKFYNSGLIDRIPEHYVLVGSIENFWEHHNVVGLKIEAESIKIGDRIGYVLGNDYLEEEIKSMQVEKVERIEATIGELVGIKTIFNKDELKKKINVYKLRD